MIMWFQSGKKLTVLEDHLSSWVPNKRLLDPRQCECTLCLPYVHSIGYVSISNSVTVNFMITNISFWYIYLFIELRYIYIYIYNIYMYYIYIYVYIWLCKTWFLENKSFIIIIIIIIIITKELLHRQSSETFLRFSVAFFTFYVIKTEAAVPRYFSK